MSVTISGDTGIDKVQDEAVTPTAGVARILRLTAQASTSGTYKDFTGIPSWAKKITVMFSGVSTNGSSFLLIQLGSSAGIVTTGYISIGSGIDSSVVTSSFTTGIGIRSAGASNQVRGNININLEDSNKYVASYVLGSSVSPVIFIGSGEIALPEILDKIRITTVNGTDVFDAGTINVLVEG